jgi:predicted HTH transcriptional regulator
VEKILQAIKINPNVTIKGLQTITGLSRRGVEYQLSKLKEKQKIKRIGPAKGGHWIITEYFFFNLPVLQSFSFSVLLSFSPSTCNLKL